MRRGRPLGYWQTEGPSEIVATPVFWKNRVYVSIGRDMEHSGGPGRLVCLDATGTGDLTESGVIWSYKRILQSMATVSIDPTSGLLFLADFDGFIHCLNAETGEAYWAHDVKAHTQASTLVADGKVFVGDENGAFWVLAASRKKRVLNRKLEDGRPMDWLKVGTPIYSTPVVANGVLYVASTRHLYAIYDAAKAAKSPSK